MSDAVETGLCTNKNEVAKEELAKAVELFEEITEEYLDAMNFGGLLSITYLVGDFTDAIANFTDGIRTLVSGNIESTYKFYIKNHDENFESQIEEKDK